MILTVLLASVTLPAFAVVYPYTLKDCLIDEETLDNGDVTATFGFNKYDPHMTIFSQGMVYFDGRLQDLYGVDCTGRDFMNFHAWPLGHKYNAGDPITYGVLDIRDFKEHSTLRVSAEGDLHYAYIFHSEAPGNAYLTPSATIYFHFYDENGKYIRSLHDTSGMRITLPEQPDGVQSRGTAVLFSQPYELTILANAAYVVPAIECTVTLPGNEAGVQIVNLTFDISDFRLHSSYNMFKEDSETMKAIEAELEETNDHLGNIEGELSDANAALGNIHQQNETIINGTNDQRQEAQDKQDQMENASQDLDEMIEELGGLENYDTSSSFETITNFLSSSGWYSMLTLTEPIFNWQHMTTILLIVVAFSTISILFFGR